jgi:hypothetical protein
VAGDLSFNGFKNKTEISSAIDEVQLSRSTLTKRVECMSGDTEQQLRQNLEICELFRLQLDESADVCDVYQLLLLFGWSSAVAILRRSCWKQYRYMVD